MLSNIIFNLLGLFAKLKGHKMYNLRNLIVAYLSIINLLILFTTELCFAQKSKNYLFTPDNCEYSVTFPLFPEITEENKTLPDGSTYKCSSASLNLENNGIFSVSYIYDPNKSLSNDEKKKTLIEFAQACIDNQKLDNTSIEFKKNHLGFSVSVIGYKYFLGKLVTIGNNIYYGENTILFLMFGCLAIDYPTKHLTNFVNSVER